MLVVKKTFLFSSSLSSLKGVNDVSHVGWGIALVWNWVTAMLRGQSDLGFHLSCHLLGYENGDNENYSTINP